MQRKDRAYTFEKCLIPKETSWHLLSRTCFFATLRTTKKVEVEFEVKINNNFCLKESQYVRYFCKCLVFSFQ